MRLTTLFLSLSMLMACGDELGSVGADALWQVRCPRGFPGCAMSGDEVNVLAFDGVDGARVSCNVSEDEAGNRTVDLDIGLGRDPSISIRGLVVTPANAVLGAGCNVTIVDDSNTLNGSCGGAPASEAQPCEISNARFEDRMEGPAFSFGMLCRNVQAPAAPTMIQRDLTRPNVPTEAAPISVFNCNGF